MFSLYITIAVAIIAVLLFQALITGCCGVWASSTASIDNLPSRQSPLHVKRKLQHFGSGLVLLAIDMAHVLTPHQEAGVVLLCAAVFLVVIHVTPRDLFVSVFKDLLRVEEANGLVYPATLWFLLGCATLLLMFPKHPAIYRIALLHLSAGDPIAGVIGGLFGKTKLGIGKKSWEGTVACAIVCGVATSIYLVATMTEVVALANGNRDGYGKENANMNEDENSSDAALLVLCTLSGIVGGVSELIPAPVDDNLSLPIFSGLGMWLLNEYVIRFSISSFNADHV